MKKARLFTLFALIAMLALLVLVGCRKENKITSISLKDHDPNTAIEIAVGDFDFNSYNLVVSYETGMTEEIALTKEMIAATDLLKLYQIGEHDITVSYGEHKYAFKVSVKRATFGDLTFPENNVFTYDGEAHTVEVEGSLPANAVVTYPGGNSFVNAGTYDVTEVVSCEGYVTARITTTVKIERAKYDMSGISFEAKEVVYDGKAHTVAISGALPEGVSAPQYVIDGNATSKMVDAGEYRVTAIFENKNVNYENIPPMETTLKILPAEYVIEGVDLVFKNGDGSIIKGGNKVYEGMSVSFDLNDYYPIYGKATVSFSVYDKNGALISSSNKDTKILNAGIYIAKADFILADSKNYKPIEPIVRVFEIKKAEYSVGDVYLETGYFEYDQNPHYIEVKGEVPEDCDVYYEYYLNGELVTDADGNPARAVIDAGRYTVKAIFKHNNENYGEAKTLSALLQIAPTQLKVSQMHFFLSSSAPYDGTARYLKYVGVFPEGVTATYEYYLGDLLLTDSAGRPVTSVVNAGVYTVKIKINNTNKNYISVDEIEYEFVIEKAVVDITGFTVSGEEEHIYSGNEYRPTVENIPESVNKTEKLYIVDDNGNRTEVASAVGCGKYILAVTFTAEDEINYMITGEVKWKDKTYVLSSEEKLEFAFEIKKKVIDLDELFENNKEYEFTGADMRDRIFFEPTHDPLKNYVNYSYMNVYVINSDGSLSDYAHASDTGNYMVQYLLTLKDQNNYSILYNGREYTSVQVNYTFSIVRKQTA